MRLGILETAAERNHIRVVVVMHLGVDQGILGYCGELPDENRAVATYLDVLAEPNSLADGSVESHVDTWTKHIEKPTAFFRTTTDNARIQTRFKLHLEALAPFRRPPKHEKHRDLNEQLDHCIFPS